MSNWQKELTAAIGQRVKDLRGQRTAVWLSETTEKLGMKVSRSAISELESGKRRSISVAEWLILAAALEVPPLLLLFPGFLDGKVAPLPGVSTTARNAQLWASGEDDSHISNGRLTRVGSPVEVVRLAKEWERVRTLKVLSLTGDSDLSEDELQRNDEKGAAILDRLRELGAVVGTQDNEG